MGAEVAMLGGLTPDDRERIRNAKDGELVPIRNFREAMTVIAPKEIAAPRILAKPCAYCGKAVRGEVCANCGART